MKHMGNMVPVQEADWKEYEDCVYLLSNIGPDVYQFQIEVEEDLNFEEMESLDMHFCASKLLELSFDDVSVYSYGDHYWTKDEPTAVKWCALLQKAINSVGETSKENEVVVVEAPPKFIGKKANAVYNGWNVKVNYTENPKVVFLFYMTPVKPTKKKPLMPAPVFVDPSKLTDVKPI